MDVADSDARNATPVRSVGSSVRSRIRLAKAILLASLVVAFLLTPGILIVSPARAASTPYVYVATTGSDTAGNGSASAPFATISYAVSTAPPGAIVVVSPGTYKEMVVITQELTLQSQTFRATDVIVNALGKANGIVVLGPSASGTVVDGFTIENADNHGIYVEDANNVVIENNIVSDNGLNVIAGLGEVKALQLAGSSNSTVAGNSVIGNLYGGIGIADDGPILATWNNTAVPGARIPDGQPNPGNNNFISANVVMGNRPNHCSIVISSYNQGEGVSNNIVSYNTVVDNTAGIIVAADTANTVAINNSVIFNTILNDNEAGVVLHSNAPGDVVTGNVVTGNVIGNDGSGATPTGILVGGEGPVAVLNSTITDNIFQNEYCGIQIVNGNYTFVGGNNMAPSIPVPINGTVTFISTSSAGSSGSSSSGNQSTSGSTSTGVQTSSTQVSSGSILSGGGISFSLALLTAVGTLIVGMVAGIIIRPPRTEK
jgi:parallel beta-helix repeat protein